MKALAARLWDRFTGLVAAVFRNSRPQFHYALLVFYFGLGILSPFLVVLIVCRLFGSQYSFNLDLLGTLLGALAFGGLVAGHVDMLPTSERVRRWLVPICFGGTTVTSLQVIGSLRGDTGPSLAGSAGAFAIGAGLFVTLAWLMRLDAAAKAKASAPES